MLTCTLVLFPEKYLLGEVREKAGMQQGCTYIHIGDVAVMSDVWSGKKSLGEASEHFGVLVFLTLKGTAQRSFRLCEIGAEDVQ